MNTIILHENLIQTETTKSKISVSGKNSPHRRSVPPAFIFDDCVANDLQSKLSLKVYTMQDLLSALSWAKIIFRQKRADEVFQPLCTCSRFENRGTPHDRAWVAAIFTTAYTPSTWNEPVLTPKQKLFINYFEHRIITVEFSGEWSITLDHPLHVLDDKVVRMLLRRVVP